MILSYNGKNPRIGKDVYIAPTAVVIGDVHIADGASVWFGAVVRGDMDAIRIGKNTNIQDNCVLHVDEGFPAFIGDNVTVGHHAVVHGCTVENRCLIGINSVVLNGARIREGSVVAAGSVVRQGQVCGPWELVAGIPAGFKKKLPETAPEDIPQSVKNYLSASVAYREVAGEGH
ncbi:MAG: gamma carbonic anhydrase family protein [Desulfobacteraceae bacterium]|jgi:carbonic anhydrase/acetyltransferase-like protein (isoleucine patch superfamily)|nr:gamma carbonic anhydrase family protein [Desulfobacteraceae bacterium]